MLSPSDNRLKMSVEQHKRSVRHGFELGDPVHSPFHLCHCQHHASHSTPLTVHAFQAQDEADEAFQCHVTRGGGVAQGHQVEHVVTQHYSCVTHGKNSGGVPLALYSMFVGFVISYDLHF